MKMITCTHHHFRKCAAVFAPQLRFAGGVTVAISVTSGLSDILKTDTINQRVQSKECKYIGVW